jgi:hypothetical protein
MTLLFREAELNQTDRSMKICVSIIDSIKLPETSFELHNNRDVVVGLKNTLMWMLDKAGEPYDLIQLQQRIRINTKDDTYLYNAFIDAIQPIEDSELKKQILQYRKFLQEYLDSLKINSIISDAYRKANFTNATTADLQQFVRDVYAQLEPFTHDIVDRTHPSVVDAVSFDNEDDLSRLLTQSKEETSNIGALKTGWHGINRMLGETGGFRRGEFALVGALPHNFKTGFSLNLFKHFALYNKPHMRDTAKKPMLMFVSLENELPMNIMWLYVNLKENETGEPCSIQGVNIKDAARYIRERMGVNGYHIEMLRLEPGQCTYRDFFDLVMKYETEGYEIHAIVCDYLSMMDKKGLETGGPSGSNIRELFKRVRNFTAPRGITFITPHQLSTEAKVLTRQGVTSFVKEVAGKGYYADCRSLDNDPDLEIVLHIETIAGEGSFLTCQRGKHRGVTITKPEDRYCVLPFSSYVKTGGILDDINREDTSLKAVGTKKGEGEADNWYEN